MLKYDGIPMPSIAIAKKIKSNAEFGEISLIFRKDTIDPEATKDNKVYGSDAWTPRFPRIDYELDDKKSEKIYKRAMDVSKGIAFFNSVDLHPNNLKSKISGGFERFIDDAMNDYGLKNMFLAEKNEPVKMIRREDVKRLSDGNIKKYDFFISKMGDEIVRSENLTGDEWNEYFTKYQTVYREYLKTIHPGISEENIAAKMKEEPKFKVKVKTNAMLRYMEEGPERKNIVDDESATEAAIDEKIDETEYKKWLTNLFDGVIKSEGIPNGVDPYTRTGNRKSFSATHYEVTLENIVKAMKKEENGDTFFKGIGIFGVSAKEYKNIDEIKTDSGRLESIPEEEYSQMKNGFGQRLEEIAESIGIDNDYSSKQYAMENIVDAVRNSKTRSGIYSYLKKFNPKTTELTVQDIVNLVDDIANMPVEYFEAKPRRIVDYDEVVAAVVPNNIDANLKDKMKEKGLNIVEYEADNEAYRIEKVNSVPDIHFSFKDSKGGYVALLRAGELLLRILITKHL